MADRRYQLGGGPPAMRALSIRQPWLWAIFHGGKTVENRDWAGCDYRGPILLHASKGCGKQEFEDAADAIMFARADLGLPPREPPPLEQLPRGCICGIACIVNAVRHPNGMMAPDGEGWDYRVPGALGLQLAHVRELPTVPYKGSLNFWSVSHDQLATVAGFEVADVYRSAWRELVASSRRAA